MPSLTRQQVAALCRNLSSPVARVRYGAGKLLVLASEQDPRSLYHSFDFFAELLDGPNTILRWNATRILGNLAVVDRLDKLDELLPRYFAPVAGPEMIGAANAIQAAAAIALAKPNLADRIAGEIIKVDGASYRTAECRNVAIGHAIASLSRFFPQIRRPAKVLAFVRAQVSNTRPSTRAKAEKFLRKWCARRAA